MAIELQLNRYTAHPSERENEPQRLKRRNRERTYLVLFVHDRSLSMQTGLQWMLSEDDIVLNSEQWHQRVPSGVSIRPEDVILAAFVSLRRIAVRFYLFIRLSPLALPLVLITFRLKLFKNLKHYRMKPTRLTQTLFTNPS